MFCLHRSRGGFIFRICSWGVNDSAEDDRPPPPPALMAPNAVKFMLFMSIIMHTGGPKPRYIPTGPSVRTMFTNVLPATTGRPRPPQKQKKNKMNKERKRFFFCFCSSITKN